jgi:hypothetical protein
MKRFMQCALTCAAVLSLAATAMAQSVPEPVTRLGDWVEIGKDTFMNIIGNLDIRYNTTHEYDFEKEVQERMNSRNLSGTSTTYIGEGDFLEAEVRWGADFRYQKNLLVQILFETQGIFDGNLIDDRNNNNSPENGAAGPASIGNPSGEDNSPHVERFWIDYKFNPVLRMRVGADFWTTDAGGWIGDDDPRFAVYITPTDNLELLFAAVIQSESARLGLTNDNDDVYYTFGGDFKSGPHTFGLHGAYFRTRFNNELRADTFLIMPHVNGKIPGPVGIEYLLQFGYVGGKVDDSTDGNGGDKYDVMAYGAAASIRASLAGGMIRPFLHVWYGSADDDAQDNDLTGFQTTPWREIATVGAKGIYSDLDGDSTFDDWGPAAGARAAIGGGSTGSHTTGNPFRDRLGNNAHAGTIAAYSNAGTLVIPAGVSIYPAAAHRFTVYYTYVGFLDDETLRHDEGVATGVGKIKKDLYHQISAAWEWTINSHFDVRLLGAAYIPGEGTKDIAETVTCDDGDPCKGEDIAFRGVARFRARF